MGAWFVAVLVTLIVAEIVKGLSANGTPPLLQKFAWQLDLAYIMWNSIATIRIACFALLVGLLWAMYPSVPGFVKILGPILLLLWAGVMWLFNFFWVGKVKFDELPNPTFVTAAQNQIDLDTDIMGTEHNGEAKAYPIPVVAWHHRIQDEVGQHPIWVTYCGMCMSGRIYDRVIDGEALDFSLIGAITYNATFRDDATRSWWRQETGEAVKGPRAGDALKDMYTEHMTLGKWLEKYPDSKILQYAEAYREKYEYVKPILEGKAWFPKWQMHKKLQRIAGVDVGGHARAYDREQVTRERVVNDTLGDLDLVILCSADGRSTLAYRRRVNGTALEFSLDGEGFRDKQTGSRWNLFGECEAGQLAGTQLEPIQIRQQHIRSWTTFHPNTSVYAG